ncbi:PREDICTED: uncharacterized protein LOC105585126 [Cercocebus atys]|uniref:uncharacterized protein LOC105585126 n=1 Tax=Cercocebus atys TaxID=9531 RepID=UPI0005F3D0FE|nr:PREDICTED: uncharacterized protein LOC105585126 [Cercocebus atys]
MAAGLGAGAGGRRERPRQTRGGTSRLCRRGREGRGAAAERVPGGAPGGQEGLRGAHSPAPELSPKSSQLRLGLPGQLSPASRSQRSAPTLIPRSVATGLGRTHADRGVQLRRLPRDPLIAERAGVLRLLDLSARSSHSPAEPPGGLGVGARGAGAGERGLKASQALQRPTRACTPPPVPAEKSSSYPRLHRSAFLFQSAGRLVAPPFSGQAQLPRASSTPPSVRRGPRSPAGAGEAA